MSRISQCRWVAVGGFALLASTSGYRAVSALLAVEQHVDGRTALGLVYAGCLFAVLAMVTVIAAFRPPSLEQSESLVAYAATAAAVGGLVFIQPPVNAAGRWQIVGETIAVVAGVWLVISVVALGRCFGLLPEARGLVTRGPYRIVQHPVYLGEIAAVAGLVLASPTPRNAIVLAVFTGAQRVRMRLEEKALGEAYPEYAAYAKKTPRLIPRLLPLRRSQSSLERGLRCGDNGGSL